MDFPVHHLDIKIWEDSLGYDHDHENDHEELVGAYGYVTGSVHISIQFWVPPWKIAELFSFVFISANDFKCIFYYMKMQKFF